MKIDTKQLETAFSSATSEQMKTLIYDATYLFLLGESCEKVENFLTDLNILTEEDQ